MGVLFDYTQAEEAEPVMRCLGRFVRYNGGKSAWRLEQTATTVSPHARTSQNWLFICVCVCLCVLDPCSQLHNAHLHWVLCMCVCVLLYVHRISHIQEDLSFWLQYLPNCSICVFLRWTLQWILWSFVVLSPSWQIMQSK